MLYPYKDINVKGGYKPILTWIFIAINIAVWCYEVYLGPAARNAFVHHYGAVPAELTHGQDWLMAWTSMFIHGGWFHIIGNMLFLYVFADNIEALVGHVRFFFFYFLGGLAAVLLHTIMDWNSSIPMVGASGCISAVLGAYLIMQPRGKVKLMFFFFVRFWVPALLFLIFWAVQQFVASFASIAKTTESSGIAYWAHVGGFVFGVLSGIYFRMTRKYK
jgi:membrane associated rhomboid family serine protease